MPLALLLVFAKGSLFACISHISPGSFPGTLPSEASPPISIDSFYVHILREFRTNWKLKEMKGNNPLMYFILLRRHYISVPYFNRKTI